MVEFVSLTIPCYNEGKFIFKAVKRLQKAMDSTGYKYEIILFDDKSTDDTAGNIKKIAGNSRKVRAFFHKQNQGRGQTVKDAISKAGGSIVGFVDIDLEVNEKYIPLMLDAISKDGADIAIGVRETKFSWEKFHRWILSRGYNLFVRKMLGLPLKDTESGCKFFNKESISMVMGQTKNKHWFWDTEIMALAYYEGLEIAEIPVVFEKNIESGSTVKIFSDTFDYVKEVMSFRKRMKQEKLL